jgi:hypothetical protein
MAIGYAIGRLAVMPHVMLAKELQQSPIFGVAIPWNFPVSINGVPYSSF